MPQWVWTVFLILLTLISHEVSAATTTSTAVISPTIPLLNVPFQVSASFLQQGQNIYISRTSTCETAQVAAPICTIPENKICEFTITPASVGVSAQYDVQVPTLYICSSALSQNLIQNISVNVINAIPRFVFSGTRASVRMGNDVPIGSIIGFFSDEACENEISNMSPVTLGSDRQINIIVSSGDVLRLCARVLLYDGKSLTSYVPAATLLIVSIFSVNSTQVLRHTSETFRLTPFNQIPWGSFSLSPLCETLLQEPIGGFMLQIISLPIRVPKGDYYFCAGLPYYMSKRLYIPSSNMIKVQEYGIQPHTLYSGISTSMTFSLDAIISETTAMTAALFNSPNCLQNVNIIIPWGPLGNWIVDASGTYYACVRKGNSVQSTALASNISVINAPEISTTPSIGIRGLEINIMLSNRALSNKGIITVGLSLTSDCTKLVSSGTTTENGNNAKFLVPTDALSTMTLCVSTPISSISQPENRENDIGYSYSLSQITTRQYILNYDTIFAGKSVTIQLDPNVELDSGTKGIFAKDTCSQVIGSEFAMDVSTLNNVVFDSAGIYLLCVKIPSTTTSSILYSNIGRITVYGPILISPSSIILGYTTNISISLIPSNAPIHIVTSENCNSQSLFEGTANAAGVINLQLLYNSEADLTVCVGYRGSINEGSWNIIPVSTIPVARINMLPQTIITSKSNRLNFIVPDKLSLSGFQVFINRGASASCASPPPISSSLIISIQIPTDNGRAFILYTPSESTVWSVCLGNNRNTFTYIGDITSVNPVSISTNPSIGIIGLPIIIELSGASLAVLKPTKYFITNTINSCTLSETTTPPIFAEGNIDTTNWVTDSFMGKEMGSFIICIGWSDNEANFFVYGGNLEIGSFTSLSRYAIRDSTNNLIVSSLMTGASLFLVSCTTSSTKCNTPISINVCTQATQRYYTSSLVPLRGANVGNYVLCQEDSLKQGMAVSTTLISVINAFILTLQDSEIRQYKSTPVIVSGGDVNIRNRAITISSMPPGVMCGATNSQREDFNFPIGVLNGNITITKISSFTKGVQLCIGLSPNDIFLGTTFNLLSYMTPATIIADRKMSIRSGMWKENVLSKLSSTSDCTDNVMSINPVLIKEYISELIIDGCTSINQDLNSVYYCESNNAGSTYNLRGVMPLIHLKNCSTDHFSAILPITVPPVQPFTNYGINTNLLENPVLSKTSDCQNLLNTEKGYTPSYDETPLFFVCVNAKGDSNYIFTTDNPTLGVINFLVSPRTIPGRLSATIDIPLTTQIELNYPTGTTQTFLSNTVNCDDIIANTPGLNQSPPRATLLLTGISGLKYICVSVTSSLTTTASSNINNNGNIQIAVGIVLVINPPRSIRIDPALVRGAPFRATLQLITLEGQPPLYSLIQGADSDYDSAYMYTSSFRGIYLSNDMCLNVLRGTSITYISSTGRITLSTNSISTGLTSVSLCAGTPAGNLTVTSNIEVSTAVIFPSQFVLGSDKEVFIPLSPNSVFHLKQDSNCEGNDNIPIFTTNEEGRGILSFKLNSGKGLPPAGEWTICKEDSLNTISNYLFPIPKVKNLIVKTASTLKPIATIDAFNPVYFDIRGSDIILGTPGTIFLLNDLSVGNLLPGFSTDRSCSERGESYGSWQVSGNPTGNTNNSKSITIIATKSTSSIYLCAITPINNSIVSIPLQGALHFVTPTISFPTTIPRCGTLPLSSCALPGTSPTGAFISIIRGDCCNLADRGNVIGSSTRTNNNQCGLTMDSNRVNDYPLNSEFSICAWDSSDDSYCTTLGHVKLSSDTCTDNSITSENRISDGALIALIIIGIILGLILIAVVIWLVIVCYNRQNRHEHGPLDPKQQFIIANPLSLDSDSSHVALFNSPGREISQYRAGSSLNTNNNNNIPFLFGVRRSGSHTGGDSQHTITVNTGITSAEKETTPTDTSHVPSPTSSDNSPVVLRVNFWKGIEGDERDQIALQEARDRYNMRINFTEGIERIRLAQKEKDLQFELSDEDYNPFEEGEMQAFNNNNNNSNSNNSANTPSAPPMSEIEAVEVIKHHDETLQYQHLKQQQELEVAVGRTLWFSDKSHDPRSRSSSVDPMGYTITQRFYDDRRFTLENEAARRQRICNWEEEEWHGIINAEFNSYITLQQSEAPPPLPPPPLSQNIELPFSTIIEENSATGSSNNNKYNYNNDDVVVDCNESEDDDIYDAPSCPAQLTKYGDSGDNIHMGVSENNNNNNSEMYVLEIPSQESIFSISTPSLSKAVEKEVPNTPNPLIQNPRSSKEKENKKEKRKKSKSKCEKKDNRHFDPISCSGTPPSIYDDDDDEEVEDNYSALSSNSSVEKYTRQ